jgi:periplasmic divalent cation tolerance protein
VGEPLAACVNIIGPTTTSKYHWKDELKKSREFIGIAKTSSEKVKKSLRRLIELHSYKSPAAIVIDIEMGNNEFISWIHKNVS